MNESRSEHTGDDRSTERANYKSDESTPKKEKSFYDRFWDFAESHIPPAIDKDSEAGKRRNHCKEEIKFGLEILGFIIGVIVAGIFLYQSCEMRNATVAANKQLAEMQDSRKLDERAWISSYGIEQIVSDDKTSELLIIDFRNTGKTPALNTRNVITVGFDTNHIQVTEGMPISTAGMISPQQDGKIYSNPIPSSYLIMVANGTPIFVWGTIWYDDIFGRHHWCQFCFKGQESTVNKAMINFIPTAFHNTCDDAKTTDTE